MELTQTQDGRQLQIAIVTKKLSTDFFRFFSQHFRRKDPRLAILMQRMMQSDERSAEILSQISLKYPAQLLAEPLTIDLLREFESQTRSATRHMQTRAVLGQHVKFKQLCRRMFEETWPLIASGRLKRVFQTLVLEEEVNERILQNLLRNQPPIHKKFWPWQSSLPVKLLPN